MIQQASFDDQARITWDEVVPRKPKGQRLLQSAWTQLWQPAQAEVPPDGNPAELANNDNDRYYDEDGVYVDWYDAYEIADLKEKTNHDDRES